MKVSASEAIIVWGTEGAEVEMTVAGCSAGPALSAIENIPPCPLGCDWGWGEGAILTSAAIVRRGRGRVVRDFS